MKFNCRSMLVLASVVFLSGCAGGSDTKEVNNLAQPVKAPTPENSGADKRVVDFLSSATEMRKMNIIRGEMAQREGKSQALREYGALLIEDQSKMLKEINAIVEVKKITLPKFIDFSFNEEQAALRNKKGEAFDRFFISLMIQHHLQEAQAFREAITFQDSDVKIFAVKYLPLIEQSQSQLQEISYKPE
jgi:putative membrane protein